MLNLLHYSLAGLVGLLALATVIVAMMIKSRPERNYTELKLRVYTWWWILGVFALAIAVNRTVSAVVMGLVSLIAFKEYLSLTPMRLADRSALFWAFLSIPLQYVWVAIGWYGMFIIFIPVYAFLFLPMRMVLVGQTQGFLRAAGTLHWGLMTTVFSLSHLAYLISLPDVSVDGRVVSGAMLLFFIVVLTQLNDVAQYIWGKSFGRHKVIPSVSPGKTVEGLLGGVATTVVLAYLAGPYFTPMSQLHCVFAGVLISISGFVGDVVMSAVKRDVGVKDSGTLLPGHGGILDRLDSLTYTGPLFFHYVYYLYY